MTFESVFVWRSIGAQDGWSPLGYAAFNGHTRVVRMLLLHSAVEVNLANKVSLDSP